MADQQHLEILKQGGETWNRWRKEHLNVQPDFSEVDFGLARYDLVKVNLSQANLREARLSGVNLRGANLIEADLSGAQIADVNLIEADLRRADLSGSWVVNTNLARANLTDCRIYGVSAWNVQLTGAKQLNLIITPGNEPTIRIDNFETAQFINSVLNYKSMLHIIDTIAKKVVLILGRFTPEWKTVLDALRKLLHAQDYVPILIDFDKQGSQDFTDIVTALAHLSRFIVADLTDPGSIPLELRAIVAHHRVPVQPLLRETEDSIYANCDYSMIQELRKNYPWVLPTLLYEELEDLRASLQEHVIDPAERKAQELEKR